MDSVRIHTAATPMRQQYVYGVGVGGGSGRCCAAYVFPLDPLQQAVLGGAGAGLLVTGAFRSVVAVCRKRRPGLFVRRRPPVAHRCPRCRGFGIVRCNLCHGSGFVEREKPMNEIILCPLCVSNRYVDCDMCHGTGRRPRPNTPPWPLPAFERMYLAVIGFFVFFFSRAFRRNQSSVQ